MSTNNIKPSAVTTTKLSKEETEKLLQKDSKAWGNKLAPIKERNYKVMADIEPVKHSKADINPPSRPKLLPEHLSAVRLKELVAQGKTMLEIMRMYNFVNTVSFKKKVKVLGCSKLFLSID